MTADKSASTATYYDNMLHLYKQLAVEAEFAIEQEITKSDIKIHSSTSRVKDRNSVVEKVNRKSYANPAEEIEDFVGLRVVCLFTSDLPRLHNIVHSLFSVYAEEDKIASAPVESFGYMSIHYICKLNSTASGPRYDQLKDIKFEVQCRTILMDAWANVSHYLAYKQGSSLPSALQKDFHALAGLFHVADKQFESFFNESQKSQTDAASTVKNSEKAESADVNRDTLIALLEHKFPDRVYSDPEYKESVAELAEELLAVKYTNIHAVAADIESGEADARESEKYNPPYDPIEDEPTVFSAVGLARQAISRSNPEYSKYKSKLSHKYSR